MGVRGGRCAREGEDHRVWRWVCACVCVWHALLRPPCPTQIANNTLHCQFVAR